jgi:hypothetical protein
MKSRARTVALLAVVAAAPALALAQTTVPTTGGRAATTTAPAGTDTGAPPAPGSTDTPAKPVVPATGFGWSTPHVKLRKPTAKRAKSTAPDVIEPGFETLADGSSRLFVELSKQVPFETKTAAGSITYVLKGAHVDKRNNYNPLVTVHFNTPVSQARLVPHGSDLYFVVELRAAVQPTATMDAGKDGTAILKIEFPGGSWLPAQPGASAGPAASSAPPAASSGVGHPAASAAAAPSAH